MSVIAHGTVCPQCQVTVDNTKPGWGHRRDAEFFCSQWTYTVPDDLKTFLQEQPKDATPGDLLDGWLKTKFGIDRNGNDL